MSAIGFILFFPPFLLSPVSFVAFSSLPIPSSLSPTYPIISLPVTNPPSMYSLSSSRFGTSRLFNAVIRLTDRLLCEVRFLRCGRECGGAPDGRGERPDASSIIGEVFWRLVERFAVRERRVWKIDIIPAISHPLGLFLVFTFSSCFLFLLPSFLSFSLSFFLLTSSADKSYEDDSITEWELWLANWGEGWR